MIDELLLLSGNDIPFIQGNLVIHQPRLREIAYITEQNFWPTCELLKFNKEILPEEERQKLLNFSNFSIILSMLKEKHNEAQKVKVNVMSLFSLLFPMQKISFNKNIIQLRNNNTGNIGQITENNFQVFKEILINIFCLNDSNKQYNPSGDLAKKIVDKFARARQKKAKLAPKDQKNAVLSRYVSILAVGERKNINDLMNYTVYQLMDEFNRFMLKTEYDAYIQFKCAGATNMKQPEDWFKDIYDNKNKEN